MKILLVNDDGIHAPGLKALWEVVKDLGDVTIVAPSDERSGSGASISMYHPLLLHPVDWSNETKAFRCSGTPADCVKIALSEVYDTPPDLILSGINPGPNHGRNVLYSGTVGAVIEGTLHGVPGCAVSCTCDDVIDFAATAKQVPAIVQFLQEHPLPAGSFLNVNYPSERGESPKGIRFCRAGQGYWRTTPDRRFHPEGHPYFWLGGAQADCAEAPDSDVRLLKEGYMVVTPVRVADLTCEQTLASHADAFEKVFSAARA